MDDTKAVHRKTEENVACHTITINAVENQEAHNPIAHRI